VTYRSIYRSALGALASECLTARELVWTPESAQALTQWMELGLASELELELGLALGLGLGLGLGLALALALALGLALALVFRTPVVDLTGVVWAQESEAA
jgi:hypothetical protein